MDSKPVRYNSTLLFQIKNFFFGKTNIVSRQTKIIKLKFLKKVIITMFIMVTIAFIASFFDSKNNIIVTLIFNFIVFSVLFGFYYLLKKEKLNSVGWGLSLFFWTTVALVTLFFDGLKGQNAVVFCVVIMFVGSIFGGRIAVLFAIITTIWILIIGYLEFNNLLPTPIGPGYSIMNSLSSLALTFILVAVLLYAMLTSISTNEERYRILFESSKDALTTLEIEKNDRFTSANKSALELFGVASEEEFIQFGPQDFAPKFQPDGQLSSEKAKLMNALALKNGSHNFEYVHLKANGEAFHSQILLTAISIYGVKNLQATIRDVTKLKEAEKIIEKNTDILKLQNRQLVDFCNIVSHNLRGPLVNLSMLINFLEESKDENEKVLFIEKLKPVISNLNETFDELVESIQIKNDVEILSEKNSFEETLNKSMELLKGEIIESHAIIKVDFSNAPYLHYPSKYLNSIIQNLLSNALKYSSPERVPMLFFESKKMNDSIVLSVKDNGLGIDLKRHSQNLFKIRKTFHAHPKAKGFGLYMTKAQIEAMGGRIWVESEENSGSTFFVEFKNQ